MLITLFNKQGETYKKIVPERNAVISEFYVHVLESHWGGFWERGRNFERKAVGSSCNTFPLLILPCECVKRLHSKSHILDISHPPYSPDLAPAHFFQCHKVKTTAKWSKVHNIYDIKTKVIAELNAVPLQASDDCFVQL
jgi:hypothetical protein